MHIANITSQGQVSIPIKLRRKLELDKRKQVLITEENGKIIIEPAKDILDLAGAFKLPTKIKPHKDREAFENYLAHRANKGVSKVTLKKLGFEQTSPNIFTPPKVNPVRRK